MFLTDAKIQFLKSINILGITLHKDVSYHGTQVDVSHQLKKAYARASTLRRIRRFLPHDTMIKLYKAFILPYLE